MGQIIRDLVAPANNIEISYDDSREGQKTIIFIHGFPFDKSSWKPQMNELQKHYRVIAYDHRGFGKSTNDNRKFSMDLFADDLVAFMDRLTLPKATICGLSMGGYVALNFMQRYPEKVERLILCDTQCVADTPEGVEKRMKTIDNIRENGVQIFAEQFAKNVFVKDSLENKKDIVDDIISVMKSTPEQTITSALMALAERRETCSMLGSIKVPVLILCGTEDKITTPEKSEFMHSKIAGSKLHMIHDAAHLSNLEQPDIFNKEISNFIG
jgi:3-oxoadipate enol-lactonase